MKHLCSVSYIYIYIYLFIYLFISGYIIFLTDVCHDVHLKKFLEKGSERLEVNLLYVQYFYLTSLCHILQNKLL
jgi:hypothetical protein